MPHQSCSVEAEGQCPPLDSQEWSAALPCADYNTCIYVWKHTYMYMYMYMCMYNTSSLCMDACIHNVIHMHVYTMSYICMYTQCHTYACIHNVIHMHACKQISRQYSGTSLKIHLSIVEYDRHFRKYQPFLSIPQLRHYPSAKTLQ